MNEAERLRRIRVVSTPLFDCQISRVLTYKSRSSKLFIVPRAQMPRFCKEHRAAARSACAYILCGDPLAPRSGQMHLYVGKGGPGRGISARYFSDHQHEHGHFHQQIRARGFPEWTWSCALVLVNEALYSNELALALEGRFMDLLEGTGSFVLVNQRRESPVLEPSDAAELEDIVAGALGLLKHYWPTAWTNRLSQRVPATDPHRPQSDAQAGLLASPTLQFSCDKLHGKADILLVPSTKRVRIRKGALLGLPASGETRFQKQDRKRRKKAEDAGSIKKLPDESGYVLLEDVEFSHPGMALAFVLGRRTCAHRGWRAADGRTIGEVWPSARGQGSGRPCEPAFWDEVVEKGGHMETSRAAVA